MSEVDEAQTENSDLTVIKFPARKWADDEIEPEPVPVVLVSSRDGAPLPVVPRAGWVTLKRACDQWRWVTRTTYARARVPERRYKNGSLARAEHVIESVAVRFARGAVRGYAVWRNASDRKGGYLFEGARIGPESFGWQAPKTDAGRPSILSEVTR